MKWLLAWVQVHKFGWFPEYDYVTGKKQMKRMPVVNGEKLVEHPDAMPHEAFGSTCNLVQLEHMFCAITERAVSSHARVHVLG